MNVLKCSQVKMFRCTINAIVFLYLICGYQSIELYDRLQYLVGYVINNTESQQPNLMLGIYICEALLLTMKLSPGSNAPPIQLLENIKNVREKYENQSKSEAIRQSNLQSSIVIQQLLNSSFWVDSFETNDDMIFYGSLTTTNGTMSLTMDKFAHNIDNGAPSPSESDECLAELLSGSPCTVSKRCLQIMSVSNDSHGYHLTHKLLYYMVMRFRNCSQSISSASVPLNYTIYKLCSFIWHERKLIVEMRIPNALKDLYLEQTLLCGLNGYVAFVDEHVVSEIIDWQSIDSGCYEYYDGSYDTPSTIPGKSKRNVQKLNGNCSDHMTGLAVAAFGLFAKLANILE